MKSIQETIADLNAIIRDPGASAPFIEGHGLQSRRFRFEWRDDLLSINFDLPCCRVLASEEEQLDDDAEIAAACRMAILLLVVRESGALLRDEESAMAVSCDEDGTFYCIRDAKGETVDEGGDWNVLAGRLEFALPNSDPLSIIWP